MRFFYSRGGEDYFSALKQSHHLFGIFFFLGIFQFVSLIVNFQPNIFIILFKTILTFYKNLNASWLQAYSLSIQMIKKL